MLSKEHIFVPYQILECSWYSDSKLSAMYFRLLLMASYCDCTKFGFALKSGQVLITLRMLTSGFYKNELEAMKVLENLKKHGGVLEIKKVRGYLLITVNEYDELMQDSLDKHFDKKPTIKKFRNRKDAKTNTNKRNYTELLKNPQWQKKRLKILERDGFKCAKCGCDDKSLHIHHLYYKKGIMPWEYPDDALVTLCERCHKEAHKNNEK